MKPKIQLNREAIKIKLDDIIDSWIEKCRIEKDNHVAISADEGDGKSTLLGTIVNMYPDANMWDNIVYTDNVKEFYDKYENLTEGSIIGFDEALDLINRLDWAKREVKDLVKHIRGKVRKEKRATFIYNVQLFRELHGYWRNHRIRYWIELTPREWFDGVNFAFVLERARVPFITGKRDTWLLDDNEKMWLDALSSGKIEPVSYINMLRAHPFYIGEFVFKNNESVVKKYKKYRAQAFEEYALTEVEKLTQREAMWKIRWGELAMCLKNQFGMNQTDIGKIHVPPISQRRVSQALQWVREKLEKLER